MTRPTTILPLERDILVTAIALTSNPGSSFHGYQINKALAARFANHANIGFPTVYRALRRLEDAGFLESRWESPEQAHAEGRPPRRLYALTGAGSAVSAESNVMPVFRRRLRIAKA